MVEKLALDERLREIKWHQRFEIAPGIVTPGVYNPSGLLQRLQLPDDLTGIRVLDLGARDGFFSMQCARRGAEVLAVDNVDEGATGFSLVREVTGFQMPFLHENVYNLRAEQIGKFDVILFLGVIYHLPDPCLSLEIVRSLARTGSTVYVESTCIDDHVVLAEGRKVNTAVLRDLPVMVFAGRNISSFWDMNSMCLERLLLNAELRPQRTEKWGQRMLVEAEAIEDRDLRYARVISRA